MKKTFTIGFLLINLFAIAQLTNYSNKIEERVNNQAGQPNRNSSGLLTYSLNNFDAFLGKEKLSIASQVQIVDSSLTQQWDQSANAWVTTGKNELYYDVKLNLIKDVYTTPNELVANTITEHTYDTKENKIQSIVSVWNKTKNQWVNYSKKEYTYDANNKQTQIINYSWFSTNNDWLADSKHEYSFDENGNMKLYVKYQWSDISKKWIINSKEEFTYNSNNKPTLSISSNWDLFSNDWIVSGKVEYIYDANGNKVKQTDYYWFSGPKLWGIKAKREYTYDPNGFLNEEINYSYNTYFVDVIISNLTNKTKYEYAYESDGEIALIQYYSWDAASNNWKIKNKEEYTYDSNNNMTQLHGLYWNVEKETWSSNFRFIIFYSEHSRTSVDGLDNEIIAIYPNPVSDNLQIRLTNKSAKFELFDLKGNMVLSKELKNSETLDLKNYKKGLYIYHILSNGKKHIGRLLKD
jgi:hypothetical protein